MPNVNLIQPDTLEHARALYAKELYSFAWRVFCDYASYFPPSGLEIVLGCDGGAVVWHIEDERQQWPFAFADAVQEKLRSDFPGPRVFDLFGVPTDDVLVILPGGQFSTAPR